MTEELFFSDLYSVIRTGNLFRMLGDERRHQGLSQLLDLEFVDIFFDLPTICT